MFSERKVFFFSGSLPASPPASLPLLGQPAVEHCLPGVHAPALLLHTQPHLQTVEGRQEGLEHQPGLQDSDVAKKPGDVIGQNSGDTYQERRVHISDTLE